MIYSTALALLLGGSALTALALYFFINLVKQEKIQKIRALPFDDKSRDYLLKTPHYKNLSKEDKKKIETSILLFINTKEFIGIELDVTQEMKVIIAFYACLLLLHIETENCFNNLKTIIIYSHPVMLKNLHSSGGVYTKEQYLIQGQSSNDTVVITWNEAKSEAYHLRKDNVIIHEFAHEIDFMDGEIDGVPPLSKSKYYEWINILGKEYKALSKVSMKNRSWGKYKLLGNYAASNEAEFFAVITERFFESPKSLKREFPDLYNELKSFYKLDSITLV